MPYVLADISITAGGNTSTECAFSFLGAGGLTISAAGKVITFNASGAGSIQLEGDTGITVPAKTLKIGGGTGINTSASGTTVLVNLTTPVSMANGGTGSSLSASAGSIVYSDSSALALSSVGSPSQILQSAGSSAPVWSTATYPSTIAANSILYGSAVNTISGLPAANSSVLVSTSSGAPIFVPLTGGQLLLGTSGGTPAAADLVAGAGINISNVPGTITISSDNPRMSWQLISSNQQLISNNGYFVISGALSLNLPVDSTRLGDEIYVILRGGTSWTITQIAGQQIFFGELNTTSGSGGSIASSAVGDLVILTSSATDSSSWVATGAVGNLTVI